VETGKRRKTEKGAKEKGKKEKRKKGRKEERKKGRKEEGRKRDGIQTAELDRRDQVTATNSWLSSFERGTEVDYQVAAPTESSTPNWHRARIAHQECGWKGGDRGGLAQWEQFGKRRNKEEERKNERNRLDTDRPSHGRS